jgi:prevent-host-death family protein
MPDTPTPATITASTLQRQVGTVIRRVAIDGETIIVERESWPVVVLLPVAEYKALLKDRERVDQAVGMKTEAKPTP